MHTQRTMYRMSEQIKHLSMFNLRLIASKQMKCINFLFTFAYASIEWQIERLNVLHSIKKINSIDLWKCGRSDLAWGMNASEMFRCDSRTFVVCFSHRAACARMTIVSWVFWPLSQYFSVVFFPVRIRCFFPSSILYVNAVFLLLLFHSKIDYKNFLYWHLFCSVMCGCCWCCFVYRRFLLLLLRCSGFLRLLRLLYYELLGVIARCCSLPPFLSIVLFHT